MGANATTFVPKYLAGEVLTAANLSVTNSGIPVFANPAARDAAFGGTGEKVLAEGQFAYLEDTNTTQYYDGASWQPVSSSKVAQLVTTAKTDTFTASVAAGAQTAITGLSVAITPTSATSTILVVATVSMGTVASGQLPFYSLTRGGSPIGVGAAAGTRQQATGGSGADISLTRSTSGGSITFLDSPATTSATTYAVNIGHTSSTTQTVYVNRSELDTDATNFYRTISTITVMEILA